MPLLDPRDAFMVIIDVQEKFMRAIPGAENLVETIVFLAEAMDKLGIPVLITEQYPEGLGATVEPVRRALGEKYSPISKKSFSILRDEKVAAALEKLGRKTMIVTGIETHICVLQTTLDALEKGYRVYLPVDAVASRHTIDHETALRRMEKAGAALTTAESLVYEAMKTADHAAFKDILSLVKKRARG